MTTDDADGTDGEPESVLSMSSAKSVVNSLPIRLGGRDTALTGTLE
jgi:hypothetical protein